MMEGEVSRGIFRIDGPNSSGQQEDVEELAGRPVNSIQSRGSVDLNEEIDGGGGVEADYRMLLNKLHPAYDGLPVTDFRRQLDRKLYLIVRDPTTGKWQLPSKLLTTDTSSLASVHQHTLYTVLTYIIDGETGVGGEF